MAAAVEGEDALGCRAIKERVPVFEGKFRLTQDLKISSAAEFSSSLEPADLPSSQFVAA
jgi:hypothetical protein